MTIECIDGPLDGHVADMGDIEDGNVRVFTEPRRTSRHYYLAVDGKLIWINSHRLQAQRDSRSR